MAQISSKNLAPILSREQKSNGGKFTVTSIKTGAKFTYKINRAFHNRHWYTHIKVERVFDNFIYIGYFYAMRIKNRNTGALKNYSEAIEWLLTKVTMEEFNALDKQVIITHYNKCLACGKILPKNSSTGLHEKCKN